MARNQKNAMPKQTALAALAIAVASTTGGAESFAPLPTASSSLSSTQLQMGLFDKFVAGGTGKDDLDDEYAKQQAILAQRQAPKADRDKYFRKVEERRKRADDERSRNWGWQTKQYKKGEDPIDEWRKRREDGTISDLEDQYGDPKKIGGIPIPGASFGVGGEFGVGGKVSFKNAITSSALERLLSSDCPKSVLHNGFTRNAMIPNESYLLCLSRLSRIAFFLPLDPPCVCFVLFDFILFQ